MLVHEKIEANIYYYVVYTSSQEKENKAKRRRIQLLPCEKK